MTGASFLAGSLNDAGTLHFLVGLAALHVAAWLVTEQRTMCAFLFVQQRRGVQAAAPFEVGSQRFDNSRAQGGDVLDLDPWLQDSLAASARATRPGVPNFTACQRACHGNGARHLYSLQPSHVGAASDRRPVGQSCRRQGLRPAGRALPAAQPLAVAQAGFGGQRAARCDPAMRGSLGTELSTLRV